MQTSFILSSLALLCLSHQAFAMEETAAALEKTEIAPPVKKCGCCSHHRQVVVLAPENEEKLAVEEATSQAAKSPLNTAELTPTNAERPAAEQVAPKATELPPKKADEPAVEEVTPKAAEQPTEKSVTKESAATTKE